MSIRTALQPDVLQLYCPQEAWPLFSHGGVQKLAEEYGVPFLGSIPLDPVRNRMRSINLHSAKQEMVNMHVYTRTRTHTFMCTRAVQHNVKLASFPGSTASFFSQKAGQYM